MMQCAAGVAAVYGELLECMATASCWRRGYGELLEDVVTASQAWRRLPWHDDGTTSACPVTGASTMTSGGIDKR
jgi:hypothetical protein